MNDYEIASQTKLENIVFLGDSITDFYDLDKYYSKRNVKILIS